MRGKYYSMPVEDSHTHYYVDDTGESRSSEAQRLGTVVLHSSVSVLLVGTKSLLYRETGSEYILPKRHAKLIHVCERLSHMTCYTKLNEDTWGDRVIIWSY